MAENNQLTIKFGGSGTIRVETLTDFLDEYKDLLYLINKELGYKSEDLIIEVSPPENGSFKINIKSKYRDLILDKIGDLSVGVLLGLIAIYSANSGNKKDLEEIKIILKEKQIHEIEASKIIYNIYQNSGAKQKIQQTFIIVNNDENITDLKIEKNKREIISIPKSKFPKVIENLSVTELESIPESDILKDEVTLIIKTIHFEGQAKWAFIFRGYLIKASIKDPNFINRLNNEFFRKGDALKVILSRKRNFDESLQTHIIDQNSYVIDKVLEHKSKTNDQKSINFE
jgi:hypothetical protein